MGFATEAPLFDLGITEKPPAASALAPRLPALVVTVPPSRAEVQRILGPGRVIARHDSQSRARPALLLLAFP